MMIMIDDKNKTIGGVQLSPKQYKLAKYIIERPNELITCEDIIDSIWGKDALVKKSIIYVHLSYIKRKIPNLPIRTRSGFGFIYEP